MPNDDIIYISQGAFFSSLSKTYSVKENDDEDNLEKSKLNDSKIDKNE